MNKKVLFLATLFSFGSFSNCLIAQGAQYFSMNISKLPVKKWLDRLNPRLDGRFGKKVKVVLGKVGSSVFLPLVKRIEQSVESGILSWLNESTIKKFNIKFSSMMLSAGVKIEHLLDNKKTSQAIKDIIVWGAKKKLGKWISEKGFDEHFTEQQIVDIIKKQVNLACKDLSDPNEIWHEKLERCMGKLEKIVLKIKEEIIRQVKSYYWNRAKLIVWKASKIVVPTVVSALIGYKLFAIYKQEKIVLHIEDGIPKQANVSS